MSSFIHFNYSTSICLLGLTFFCQVNKLIRIAWNGIKLQSKNNWHHSNNPCPIYYYNTALCLSKGPAIYPHELPEPSFPQPFYAVTLNRQKPRPCMNSTTYFLLASTQATKHWFKKPNSAQSLHYKFISLISTGPSKPPRNLHSFLLITFPLSTTSVPLNSLSFWPFTPSYRWPRLLYHRESRSHQTWTLSIFYHQTDTYNYTNVTDSSHSPFPPFGIEELTFLPFGPIPPPVI